MAGWPALPKSAVSTATGACGKEDHHPVAAFTTTRLRSFLGSLFFDLRAQPGLICVLFVFKGSRSLKRRSSWRVVEGFSGRTRAAGSGKRANLIFPERLIGVLGRPTFF